MKWLHTALIGFFVAVIAGIIFVQAVRQGGTSGGAQSAQIIKAGGSAITSVAAGLESGQAA